MWCRYSRQMYRYGVCLLCLSVTPYTPAYCGGGENRTRVYGGAGDRAAAGLSLSRLGGGRLASFLLFFREERNGEEKWKSFEQYGTSLHPSLVG